MASWDNFSRLEGKWLPQVVCSLALGWLVGQLVRAPQRRGCGYGLWTGLFAYERCRIGQFARVASAGRGSLARVSKSPRCQVIRKTRSIQGEAGAREGCELEAVFEGPWLPGGEIGRWQGWQTDS